MIWSDNKYYTVPSLFTNNIQLTTDNDFDINESTVTFSVETITDSSWVEFINWEVDSKDEYSDFWESMKSIYSWSELSGESIYSDLLSASTSTELSNVAEWILNYSSSSSSDYSDFVVWNCVFNESKFWDCSFK